MNVSPYITFLACVYGYLGTSEGMTNDNLGGDLAQPQSEKMYKVSRIMVTREKASYICKRDGMELLSIPDKKTNDLIASLISHHSQPDGFWTSGLKQNDNKWVWWDHQPLTFKNWNLDEPNNAKNNEYCLYMYSTGKWNDHSCETELYFICESVSTNFNRCARQPSTIILNIDEHGSVTNGPNISCCCNDEEDIREEGHSSVDEEYVIEDVDKDYYNYL